MKDYKGCRYCKHFQFNGSCAAFAPHLIPLPIAAVQIQHLTPWPEQNNSLVYEPAEKSYNERLRDLFKL